MAENNRPVHQVRIGRIKAAVFENGEVRRVLLAKTYRCLPKLRTKSTRICTSRMVLLASDGFLRPPMHHRPLFSTFGKRETMVTHPPPTCGGVSHEWHLD